MLEKIEKARHQLAQAIDGAGGSVDHGAEAPPSPEATRTVRLRALGVEVPALPAEHLLFYGPRAARAALELAMWPMVVAITVANEVFKRRVATPSDPPPPS